MWDLFFSLAYIAYRARYWMVEIGYGVIRRVLATLASTLFPFVYPDSTTLGRLPIDGRKSIRFCRSVSSPYQLMSG